MKRLLILSIIAGLITAACKKDIHLNLQNGSGLLVIEGNITNLPGPYTVYLSKTVTYYDTSNGTPVSGGQIKISDNIGNTDSLIEVSPGTYHTISITGVPGRTYHLSVYTGGKQYDAYSTMPPPVAIDSIGILTFNVFGKKRIIPAFVFVDPAVTLNYYNGYLYFNGKKISTPNPINDVGSNGMPIELALGTDSTIKVNDTLQGELDAIDLPVFNYWNSLTTTTLGNGSAAPANPTTNLSNNALGYFSAYSPTFSHTIVIDTTAIGYHTIP
jgi:hypothetical protein